MNRVNFPRFITVEGGEGSGKTTLIDKVEGWLKSWGVPVVKTREPGGSLLGNEIRNWLLNHRENVRIGAKAELLMFLAARAQHIEEVILPAISAGKVVLCDRFNESTIAYQGMGRGLGFSFVQDLCRVVCGPIVPDVIFYLDIDPGIGLQRTQGSAKENAAAGKVDRIEAETLEFHERVRQAFIEMAKSEPNRFICIDACKSREEVAENCEKILRSLFEKGSDV